MSHRKKPAPKDKPSRSKELVSCPTCGATGDDLFYGEKHYACKKCRTIKPRPRSGYHNPDGTRRVFHQYVCGKCGKTFGDKNGQSEPACIVCGARGKAIKVVKTW